MRAILGAILAALPAGPSRAYDDAVPIQRNLVDLYLGDRLKDVEGLYPPVREWPTYKEPRMVRVHVERSFARQFPESVETIRLGLRGGKVVHIQVVFTAEEARRMPLNRLVVDLSHQYGEPTRRREIYSWHDGTTVLRARNVEIPSPDGAAVELRTSLEVMDRGVRPAD